MIAAHDGAIAAMMAGRAEAAPVTVARRDLAGGGRVYEIIPDGLDDGDERVYLDLHGGALILGGGVVCGGWPCAPRPGWGSGSGRSTTGCRPTIPSRRAGRLRGRLPGAAERRPPEQIIVGGASAGGNLAAALMLRARDEGLPLPAAAVLITPEVDLTESGDSYQTNLGLDPVLQGSLMPVNQLYAAGHDLATPTSPRCSATSPRASRPPSSPPAPGTCSCPTRCGCTAPCAPPASQRTCTSWRRPATGASSARHPKMPT